MSSIVRELLEPIYNYINQDNIEEIAINKEKQVWKRMQRPDEYGRIWIPENNENLTKKFLESICYIIANEQGSGTFGPDKIPVIYGTLPGGHRFVGAIGKNIQYNKPSEQDNDGTICMCIRKYREDNKIELSDYGIRYGQKTEKILKSIFTKETDPNDDYSKIINSLTRGDHILISGPTGTGKTTLINNMIKYIDEKKRIISIEDTRELNITQENRIHILMERTNASNQFSYNDVIDLIVRMTPDIVIAGEISTRNAAAIWNLMTTGHGNFMATIHAESTKEAISRFIDCISASKTFIGSTETIDKKDLEQKISEKLRVIQISRDQFNKRRIEEIK